MKASNSTEKITPGPGAYENKFDSLTRKDGATVFGTSKQRDDSLEKKMSLIPGPGAYN